MALVLIPVAPQVPHQTQITALDGRPFRLAFGYNGRLDRWFLDLETQAGEALVRSKALVCGADLMRQIRYRPEAPQGSLFVLDTQRTGRDPAFADLGTTHVLAYFS